MVLGQNATHLLRAYKESTPPHLGDSSGAADENDLVYLGHLQSGVLHGPFHWAERFLEQVDVELRHPAKIKIHHTARFREQGVRELGNQSKRKRRRGNCCESLGSATAVPAFSPSGYKNENTTKEIS